MLGRESPQYSFLDASFSVERLLEPGSFYELLYQQAQRLFSDDDFLECYDPTTGRPSVPPSRMMKLLLLQTYEGLSDRQALERMAFDLRWKAVLGMAVDEPPVGQATLVEFRARLQLHDKMEEAFRRFVVRALEAGIIDPEAVQILDSTAIWGRGAVEDTYNLIGSAVGKLLGAVARRRRQSKAALAQAVGLVLTAPAESGSLKGRAGIDWASPQERRSFLNRVVEEARTLLAQVGAEEKEEAEVAEAAALLRRVLAQDLEPVSPAEEEAGERDDDQGSSHPSSPEQQVLVPGTEVQIRRGVAKDRIVSVGDPEMRHGHKSSHRTWEGYKAHVSAEAGHGFTTAVEVTPANVRDAQAAPELIRAQKEAGLESPAQVGDMAYSDAELRRQAERQGTKIVARVPPRRPAGGRFSKAEFRIDPEARTATCPAAHTTRRFVARPRGGGEFFFEGALCASCALRDRCTSKDPEQMRHSSRGRTIIVHRLESVLQQARADEHTSQTQALLALRPIAERSLAHLVARGLRRARYFGTAKVEFQALAIALAVNLARLGKLLWLQPELEAAWAMAR